MLLYPYTLNFAENSKSVVRNRAFHE